MLRGGVSRGLIGLALFLAGLLIGVLLRGLAVDRPHVRPEPTPAHRGPAPVLEEELPAISSDAQANISVPFQRHQHGVVDGRVGWCELVNLTRHGWKGAGCYLENGERIDFLGVPNVGLVRVGNREVPDAGAPPPNYWFRAARSIRSELPDGSARVGLTAWIGVDGPNSTRYCYDWNGRDLEQVDCARSRVDP